MAEHTFTGRSWALLASIGIVVAAVLALLITGSPDADPAVASAPRSSAATPDEESKRAGEAEPGKDAAEKRERSARTVDKPDRERPAKPSAYVDVFNNSGVTGLAGETASSLSGAGWKVLGTDNWYGSIPASTVYYPAGLKDQAALLADEVGASRVRPAVEPMLFDRLTLILTGDL